MNLYPLFAGVYSSVRRSGFLDTAIGSSLFRAAYFQYKKRIEDPFDGLIRRYPNLFRGGHIVDVGANIGYCSALFAKAIDPGRSVFALEPEPFNLAMLERTAREDGREAIVPLQAAVGETQGEIRLRLNPRHHGDHRIAVPGREAAHGTIVVPLVTLDGFLASRNATTPVCFIKIDVQGYELPVCHGAARTLEANPECSVALEYAPDAMGEFGHRPADLLDWFEQRGYRLYAIHKNGALTASLPATLGQRGYADLLFTRKDLNHES